ncbi:FixH family protein [Brevibacillus sp. RS1.1]|uniref:FixH family protein n=1 Tax=Brevibacillus sp. RS1.1 TaxID=2738982 RepID=UPI00156BBD3A|nr:FixH family protein [Brevibacillus sp. RS1.1]NRR01800.1 FixH family protein [Brevibacillus sp. RS1.1]
MKRTMILLLSMLLLLLAACGKENEQQAFQPGAPVEAAFTSEPKELVAGDTVTFSVKVTQDGQPVDDAKEVKFEWWKDGQEKHETIPASLQGDGVYTAQQTMNEPGSYFVYYHVTARDFHNMQKTPFTVTNKAGETPGAGVTPAPEAGADQSHDHGATGHANAETVDYHFSPADNIKVATPTALTVHLMKDNKALDKATVKFEFWRGTDQKHSFVDATETAAGQYDGNVQFPTAGDYTVKVHVEKGEIHDHKDFSLSIK